MLSPYDGDPVRYPDRKHDIVITPDDLAQDDVPMDDTPTTDKQAPPTRGIKRQSPPAKKHRVQESVMRLALLLHQSPSLMVMTISSQLELIPQY